MLKVSYLPSGSQTPPRSENGSYHKWNPQGKRKKGALACSNMAMFPSGTTKRQRHHINTCKENSPEHDEKESHGLGFMLLEELRISVFVLFKSLRILSKVFQSGRAFIVKN